MTNLARIICVSGLLAAVGCDDDNVPGGDSPDGGGEPMTTVAVQFDMLPALGADYVYEGWLITSDGDVVSSGRFTIDAEGEAVPPTTQVATSVANDSNLYVLTIEPAVGDDPAPTDTHVLAGTITGATSSLTTSHSAALGTDFSEATGSFILATPSTADDDSDNALGIWWLNPGEPPTAALSLPTLPSGWVYEGWVVGDDGPVSTGRFVAPDSADFDGAGDSAGPDGTPPFPGQDFISPAMNLIGGAAVISVEPEPDDSPAPFVLKPLVDENIEDVAPPNGQEMTNNAIATLPSGVVTLSPQP